MTSGSGRAVTGAAAARTPRPGVPAERIDMRGGRFLDLKHFVYRSAGSPRIRPVSLLLACALALLSGCTPPSSSQRVEDSQTSGRIRIVSVPEARELMEREVAAFRHDYPQATFELRTSTSREAVTALLGQQADLAVLTRELEPEERTVKVKGGMELEGYRFARDAICVIVHPSNPVLRITADDLRRIYSGQFTDWQELRGRPGRIEPVVPAPGSDAMASFVQRVMGGDAPSAPAFAAGSDSEIVARVLAHPGAIGFVPMAWSDRGAKLLDVSALAGLPFVSPDPETVYGNAYPLARFCNLYTRIDGPRLAGGMVTYMCSLDGQRIVHESGLVPTAVPVRFARRSPMRGTH